MYIGWLIYNLQIYSSKWVYIYVLKYLTQKLVNLINDLDNIEISRLVKMSLENIKICKYQLF